jgi:hypothetical protein
MSAVTGNNLATLPEQLTLSLAPLLPLHWFYGAAIIGLVLLGVSVFGRAPGVVWRSLALLLLLALLGNPVAERAQLQPVRDVMVLAVDNSASQNLPGRSEQMRQILPALRDQLKRFPDLDVREVQVAGRDQTLMGAAVAQAMSEVPTERRAGVILVTDGQIHDLKDDQKLLRDVGPVHALLTGRPDEEDRRIELLEVPHYGMVGKTVKLKLRVVDQPNDRGRATQIMLHTLNGDDNIFDITTGEKVTLELPVAHAGANIFLLETPLLPNDLTRANNRAVISVQGVRDKLRVLLVSGEPHPVERIWRNLLRADTAVDLVHFTILRPPSKHDGTPENELSLIGFPMQELFQDKLKSFDLIIFDRFRKQGMLPMPYFDNIARYVEEGGAFLDASGSSYIGNQSLYKTPLGRILPTAPEQLFLKQRFVPKLTRRGTEHPVTQGLGNSKEWGPWYHQTDTKLLRGQVLLTGIGLLPLLVLDRVGEGRVAQLHSDSMWLWAHGHQGGGPARELLRRLAHWLMKEPELEEDQLQLSVQTEGENYRLRIFRPTPTPAQESVNVTAPDGTRQEVILQVPQNTPPDTEASGADASLLLGQVGAYTVSRNGKDQVIVVGDPNAPELQDMLATTSILHPVQAATGGGSLWLAELGGGFELRRTDKRDHQHGSDWMGLPRNGQSIITGAQAEPLLPAWAWALLLTTCIMLGWRREGK